MKFAAWVVRDPAQSPAMTPAAPGQPAPLFGRTGRVLAELFPLPPGPAHRDWRRWRATPAAVAVLAVLAGAGLLLERQAGSPPWQSLWAEDGWVFLPGALAHPISSLTTPYAGYLELVPRLIADGAGRLLPLGRVAAGFAVGGALTAALCAALVWQASAGHVRSPALRSLLAASVLLLPLAPLEVANTGVNASWYLLFAAFWVLIWRPRSTAGMTVAALAGLAAAASTPLAVAFAPLAAARIIALPRIREHAATAGWAAGLALQVPAVLAPGGDRSYGPATGGFSFYAHEVVLAAVAGQYFAQRLQAAAGDSGAVLLAICVLAGFAGWALLHCGSRVRLFTVTALVLGGLTVTIAALTRGFPPRTLWTTVTAWQVGTRYAVVPILLIDSAAFVAVDRYLRGSRRVATGTGPGARRAAAVLLVAVLGLSWVADFRPVTLRSANPPPPLSMAALASLRVTPSALVRRLAAMDYTGSPAQRDQYAFAALGQFYRDYALPPSLTTEVYRALADVPGVVVRQAATDVAGRNGIEFFDRVALANREGHATETIIVSRRGHHLLAIQYGGYGTRYSGPIQVVILR